MKIQARLRLSSIITLVMMFLIILSFAWSLWDVSKVNQELVLLAKMQRTAFERTLLRDDYFLNGENRARIQWEAKTDQLRILLETAAERFAQTPAIALIEEMQKQFKGTVSIFARVVGLRDRRETSLLPKEGEKRLWVKYW